MPRHSSTRRSDSRSSRDSKGSSSSRSASSIQTEVQPPPIASDRNAIAESLQQKAVIEQAKMKIQELMAAQRGEQTPFKNQAAIKRDEAAVYADTSMVKSNAAEHQRSTANATKAATLAARIAKAKAALPPAVSAKLGIRTPLTGSTTPHKTNGTSSTIPAVAAHLDVEPELPTLTVADPRLQMRGPERGRRVAFKFSEKGTYEKQAQKERSQAKLAALQNDISKAAKHTGISSAVRLAIVTPSGAEVVDDLPDIEWWDRVLIEADDYENLPSESTPIHERFVSTISSLVEHPVQLKPPDAPLDNICIKAHLTKKEQQRLRRQNRRERMREEAEKVRLGLAKPPEPKVKMSNIMRVLGSDAIQDPTKMETHVRTQVAERQRKHIDANAKRKLTDEQKSEKKVRKIMEDTSVQVHVSVWKVLSLANPQKRFKVLQNAKQLQMTGVVVGVEDMHVIVIEGGPKQQRFYKNLMLSRIQWSEEVVGQKKGVAKEDDEGQRNECTLIWEGVVPNRAFATEPRIQTAADNRAAREIFMRGGVPHYWDNAFSIDTYLNKVS